MLEVREGELEKESRVEWGYAIEKDRKIER